MLEIPLDENEQTLLFVKLVSVFFYEFSLCRLFLHDPTIQFNFCARRNQSDTLLPDPRGLSAQNLISYQNQNCSLAKLISRQIF